jgi:hypothetical protein
MNFMKMNQREFYGRALVHITELTFDRVGLAQALTVSYSINVSTAIKRRDLFV